MIVRIGMIIEKKKKKKPKEKEKRDIWTKQLSDRELWMSTRH
jgi:hypothetical protein